VGHARTFWTASERARRAGGTLVMRMEDLDPDRSRTVYADAAIEDLRWLGIRWQEGPDIGGPFAPYEQNGRRAVYLNAWRELLRRGYVYPCRCSRRDLASAAAAPHEPAAGQGTAERDVLDDEPVYPGTCRRLQDNIPETLRCMGLAMGSPDGINWRFRVPDSEAVEFLDGKLGLQRFVAGVDFGDFVVWRRDGVPSYQLACVADDAAMGITEVVRGADLLKSTARQILLYRALGWKAPAWFHCELVVDKAGHRLAKRHDGLSVRTLRERGLRPEEVISSNGR
jgi:glutamyl/glutaminyl-tRNA synthetase